MAKPAVSTDVYAQARKAIRAAGFLPNPHRLGMWLGEAGLNVPSPYLVEQSSRHFNQSKEAALRGYDHMGRVLWRELKLGWK